MVVPSPFSVSVRGGALVVLHGLSQEFASLTGPRVRLLPLCYM